MYIFSDAMRTNIIKSFYWPSILNKLSVETFSEPEDKGTCHLLLLGGSVLFQGEKTLGFRTLNSKNRGIIEMLFAGDIWRSLPHKVFFC